MGRAKLRMELIGKEKSRNVTFKKRKDGLIRKLHEFTTLCDVSACMIIYGPRQDNGAVDPEFWPQNRDEISRIIGIYKARAQNKDSGTKTYCLSDFFHDRKRKIEDELAKLRKKNMESKYPTWLDLLDFLTEAQLRDFSASLSNKAEFVRSRVEFLRRNREGFGLNLRQSNCFYSPGMRGTELGSSSVRPIHDHYPTIDHHQDLHSMNHNDQFMQIGGASFKHQVFYESMVSGCGVVEPMMYRNPLAQYYVVGVPPQVQLSERENHDGQHHKAKF